MSGRIQRWMLVSGATITLAYKRWHCVGNSVESAWTKGSRARAATSQQEQKSGTQYFPPTVHYYIDFTTPEQLKVHHHSSKHAIPLNRVGLIFKIFNSIPLAKPWRWD